MYRYEDKQEDQENGTNSKQSQKEDGQTSESTGN
jgi:hypothetical protein